MGFLTNISISNDFWHDIQKDPKRLVDAITVVMNDGTNSPVHQAIVNKYGGYKAHEAEVRRLTPQGVTIHRARHYDDPQVIVNPYGSEPVDAAEIPHAISLGWLDIATHKRRVAEEAADELERTAKEIRKALKDAEENT